MSTMSTRLSAPSPSRLGFSGLSEDECLDLQSFDEMTPRTLNDMLAIYGPESPGSKDCPYGSSDAPASPGRPGLAQSLVQSLAETDSRSTDTASLILTPSSTSLLDYHGDAASLIDDPEASDSMSITPESTFSTSEGYVHVGQTDDSQDLNPRATRPFPGLEARPSPAHYSLHTSIAAALMPPHHAALASFNTSTDTCIGLSQVHCQPGATQFDSLQLPVTGAFNEDEVITHAVPFDAALYDLDSLAPAGESDFNSWGSLRTDGVGDGRGLPQTSRNALNNPIPDVHLSNLSQYHRGSIPTPTQQSQAIPEPRWAAGHIHHGHLRPQGPPMTASRPDTRPAGTPTHQRQIGRQPSSVSDPTALTNRRLEPRRAESAQTMEHAPKERKSRGGRPKNMRLPPAARDKCHKMRRTGACWTCIFQRDTCPDEGTPCQRCLEKVSKGRVMFFPCDRSKLTELRHDFLPTSFTSFHQKQTLLDQVGKEVARWDEQNCIDVYLTSAYGPALRWKVYEYVPRDRQHLIQYQYLQDVKTGHVHRYEKYSPPFGLMKLASSDEHHFERYLDRLMHPNFLWNFGFVFYDEENLIDDFLPRLVDMMCNLYEQTSDADVTRVHQILHKILRLMMITYIMGHTLTISEDTLFGVFDSIRHSQKPRDVSRRTSPRLAARQLKFFFGCMREQVYGTLLNWAQQTFHSSKDKTETWLPAFCVMLGLAMGLEEVQRTLHLQADTSIEQGVKSVAEATTEAVNACGRIDERFTLLVGLYQCKYRDRKWNDCGSFGPSTPRVGEPCQHNFLVQLHMMVREKAEYLQGRSEVPLAHENQTKYTSRLVARFLLPFLGLP
ncbi:fungal zn binuclear cluster domain containing protein [Teratosphaeria destructans]|uniref:Fungal zn binuclear cluster domain containing protein n=1 Tax=Teratosphaeria destructans TaxID=418781 RepID=A0A9W7SQL2_9PEZI|nr:fungal zn binuclear cluster domain containing protein [Teratosphaeria destructans]